MKRSVKCVASFIVIVMGLVGCSKVKEAVTGTGAPNPNKVVVVQLFDPMAGTEVPITVQAGGSKQSVAAIKHMQNEDYAAAIKVLRDHVTAGKADDRDYFALGVSLEKMDKLSDAVAAYKEANFKKSNDLYQASRRRAVEKDK